MTVNCWNFLHTISSQTFWSFCFPNQIPQNSVVRRYVLRFLFILSIVNQGIRGKEKQMIFCRHKNFTVSFLVLENIKRIWSLTTSFQFRNDQMNWILRFNDPQNWHSESNFSIFFKSDQNHEKNILNVFSRLWRFFENPYFGIWWLFFGILKGNKSVHLIVTQLI